MITEMLLGGWEALLDYVALHVLTCLIPAFLLAGAIVSFISKEAIVARLGHAVQKLHSFSLASVASFFVAACSCTVIPVASGLYYGGAGIGPAFIVLWVAPASNILALLYTGAVLGYNMALIRVISALAMAFVVGTVMATTFRRQEERRTLAATGSAGPIVARKDLVLMLLVLASLLAPNYLVQTGPYLHKVYVWAAGTLAVALYAKNVKTREEIGDWLRETWWFVRVIFPLLLGGVFLVGIISRVLPEQWIQDWLGGSGLLASFLATVIGALSYFATMTEAPFVDTLMRLGMGPGPALALLLTGPGMSLPNMLAIVRVFGARRAALYVATVVTLGTLVGWFAGSFVF